MKKSLIGLFVVTCMVLMASSIAYAYQENFFVDYGAGENAGLNWGYDAANCGQCHGADNTLTSATGPHGNYMDTTDKCSCCHDVHEALSSNKLLPATTVFGVCNTCHDASYLGSGGGGVYGAIPARGQVVKARHDIDGYQPPAAGQSYTPTSVIPGGLYSGGSVIATVTGGGVNGMILTCSNCHTPHGATSISSFLGERLRGLTRPQISTNKILQDNIWGPGLAAEPARGTYTKYGSAWCASCHRARMANTGFTGLNNHPVDATNRGVGETSATAEGSTWGAYAAALSPTLPSQHQAGYSRIATTGWDPLCQQCHEDYRNVEAAWSVTTTDGFGAGNPDYQTFPHESQAARFTVETGDDLCMNCHSSIELP